MQRSIWQVQHLHAIARLDPTENTVEGLDIYREDELGFTVVGVWGWKLGKVHFNDLLRIHVVHSNTALIKNEVAVGQDVLKGAREHFPLEGVRVVDHGTL
jgi:streptogramin lyase